MCIGSRKRKDSECVVLFESKPFHRCEALEIPIIDNESANADR
jgi:hypothetical protein